MVVSNAITLYFQYFGKCLRQIKSINYDLPKLAQVT